MANPYSFDPAMFQTQGPVPAADYSVLEKYLQAQQEARAKAAEKADDRQWDITKLKAEAQLDLQKQQAMQQIQSQPSGYTGGLINIMGQHKQQALAENPFYSVGSYLQNTPIPMSENASPWAKLAAGLASTFAGGLAQGYGQREAMDAYNQDPTIQRINSFASTGDYSQLMKDPELQQYGLQLAMERAKNQYEQQGKVDVATLPNGFRYDLATGEYKTIGGAGGASNLMTPFGKQASALENQWRDELNKAGTNFTTIEPIFQSMIQSAQKPGGVGDLDLITGVAKILDPNSTVREGENERVVNTQNLPDRVIGALSKLNNGQALSAEQRSALVDLAASRRNNALEQYQAIAKPYEQLSKDYGVPFSHVDILGATNKTPWSPPANYKIAGTGLLNGPQSASQQRLTINGQAPSTNTVQTGGVTAQAPQLPSNPQRPTNQLDAGKAPIKIDFGAIGILPTDPPEVRKQKLAQALAGGQ